MAIDWTAVDATVAAAVRARGVETDLSDAALAAFARAAVEEIGTRLGDRTGIVARHDGGVQYVFLSTPAATITSITENGVTLDAAEYQSEFGGRALSRISVYGFKTLWGGPLVITYDASALADTDRYDRVVIDLVKLAITYDGSDKAHSSGDYSESASLTPDAYQREREELIGELTGSRWGVAG